MSAKTALLCGIVTAASSFCQPYGRPPALENVGIEQRLNNQVPVEARFKDERGNPVRLGDYFRGKPVVLSLVYYRCPMLCNLVLNGELRAFREVRQEVGKDFDVVTISFDPNEGADLAAEKKANYVSKYDRGDANGGWHFLTGASDEIRAVAESVGFKYRWDDATHQWSHPSGIMVLTPEGRISRYLFGVDYSGKHVRLALAEASAGKIGTLSDKILLLCYHYDPSNGKYTFAVMNALRAGGSLTLVALCLFVIISLRRDRKTGVLGAR